MWASRKLNGVIRKDGLCGLAIGKHRKRNEKGYDCKSRQQYCPIISPTRRCARSANPSLNLTTCLTKDGDGNVSDPNWSQVIKVVYKEQNVNVPRGSQMVQIGLWAYQMQTPYPNMLTRKSQLCPSDFLWNRKWKMCLFLSPHPHSRSSGTMVQCRDGIYLHPSH